VGDSFWLYYVYLLPGEGFDRRHLLRRRLTRVTSDGADPLAGVSRLALGRFHNSALDDTWVTNVQVDPTYVDEGILGYLLSSPVDGTVEVTDCYIEAWDDHMVGAWGDCGGNRSLRRLGYALSADGPDRVPVYRCFDAAATNHFLSPDPDCEGSTTEWLLGYLLAE